LLNGNTIANTPIVTTEYVRGLGDTRITQIKEGNVLTNIRYTDQMLTHLPH